MPEDRRNSETDNWSMAIQTLKRLSNLLDAASYFSQKEDFVNWNKTLFILRRHLIPFFEDEEEQEIMNLFSELPKGWRLGGQTHPQHVTTVHKTLDQIEIKFLKIMKREGLLMPLSDNPSLALLG